MGPHSAIVWISQTSVCFSEAMWKYAQSVNHHKVIAASIRVYVDEERRGGSKSSQINK